MKKTTKLTALVLALVLTLALALTGCGKKTTTIQIAVPNDTTNEARALLLLEQQGIIKLKDGAHAQRRFESKKSCIHLMRIQIYLSFCKHTGKFILITRRSTTIELPCKKLLLTGSQCWYVINLCHNLNN